MMTIPKNCTGCTACISVCPKGCITTIVDDEGFLSPQVSPGNCIECGLCEKVCQCIHPMPATEPSEIVAVQSKDERVINMSSSGGAFFEIASNVIRQGGVVYGVAIDYSDNYKIRHIRAESKEELLPLLGSKYVQSNISGVYQCVKQDLRTGTKVLFSGTPCQVAGLCKFLSGKDENLICVDLICHGVPSPGAWQSYIGQTKESLSEKSRRIEKLSFRDKKDGWHDFGFSLEASDDSNKKKVIFSGRYENPFMKGFLADLYLRKSCHDCPTKHFSSGSDITLGDPWGIENYMKSEAIERGMSLFIPHTEKGKSILQELGLNQTPLPSSILQNHNPAAFRSVRAHKNRSKFFKMWRKRMPFDSIIAKCLPAPTKIDKIIWSIKHKIWLMLHN